MGVVMTGHGPARCLLLVPGWAPTPEHSFGYGTATGLRRQVILTNHTELDIRLMERAHRRHATVENRIKNLKDTGLSRLSFFPWDANRVRVELVQVAALLLAGLQTLVDHEELAMAEPRRLRYTLLHVAARITRHARRVWLRWSPVRGHLVLDPQLVAAHPRLDLPAGANAYPSPAPLTDHGPPPRHASTPPRPPPRPRHPPNPELLNDRG